MVPLHEKDHLSSFMKKYLTVFLMIGIFIIPAAATELFFWHVFEGPLQAKLEDVINDFNSSHSDIKVRAVFMGNYSALLKKLEGLDSKNFDYPDIFLGYSSWLSQISHEGIGMAGDILSDELLAALHPKLLEDASFSGKQFGLPFNKSIMMLYINEDLLQPKQIASLNDIEYLDTFLSSFSNGKRPAMAYNLGVWFFENLLLNLGGDLDDLSSPTAVEALDMIRDNFKNKHILIKSGYTFQDLWTSRKVPIIFSSIVSIRFMEKKIDFNWRRINYPAGKGGKPYSVVSGGNLYVNSSRKKRPSLKIFLDWFYSGDRLGQWCLESGYLPISENHAGGEILKDVELVLEPPDENWYSIRKKLSNVLKNSIIHNESSLEFLKKIK